MFKRIATAIALIATIFTGAAWAAKAAPAGVETALFAGGCFWSMESAFDKTYGVITATAGYSGGTTSNPTYENYEMNGFVESVLVSYDTSRITYDQLLDVYWHHTDPTDPAGAFVDRGPQYRPVVYYMNDAQKTVAEASKTALDASKVFGKPFTAVLTPVVPTTSTVRSSK